MCTFENIMLNLGIDVVIFIGLMIIKFPSRIHYTDTCAMVPYVTYHVNVTDYYHAQRHVNMIAERKFAALTIH